tara:strand:- start:305 stop:679 length:375 start_codon:yes stop_codon:yes gene_type:complete
LIFNFWGKFFDWALSEVGGIFRGMKYAQTFLLGALTGAMIIACGGASESAAPAGPQTVKIDENQLKRLITAFTGTEAKWQYHITEWEFLQSKNTKNMGTKGWEVVDMAIGADKKPHYLLKKRVQ